MPAIAVVTAKLIQPSELDSATAHMDKIPHVQKHSAKTASHLSNQASSIYMLLY